MHIYACVVPKDEPNKEAVRVRLPDNFDYGGHWHEVDARAKPHIGDGFELVMVQLVIPETDE